MLNNLRQGFMELNVSRATTCARAAAARTSGRAWAAGCGLWA